MKRTVLCADVRGFCSGVEHALALVENALSEGPYPVRVLHEIVHNDHVVEDFRKRGVLFLEELDESCRDGTLIFSAHGVSSAVEEQAKRLPVHLIDATCPIVKQLHRRVQELESGGRTVLLIGKKSHREVEGVIGRMKKNPVVLESVEQAVSFPVDPDRRYACLTQTTLSVDDCSEIFDVLKKRIPRLELCGSVCSATSKRQEAVKRLAERCSKIVVVGSVKSSNSKRLKEVAEKAGADAVLIPDADSLPADFLSEKDRVVGVTSGASAPEYLVRDVIRKLTCS